MQEFIEFDTVDEELSFLKGYERGLDWPDDWEHHGKPGGPYIYGFYDYERVKLSLAINKAWRLGWEMGHKIKLYKKQVVEKVIES